MFRRRLLLLCTFAVLAQLGSGCFPIARRVAWRWHYFRDCGACCAPACCTPAFRIPPPLPAVAPVGCPTCYSPSLEPATAGGPVIVPGSSTPIITSPTPLGGGPMVIPMQQGVPSPMPSKNGH